MQMWCKIVHRAKRRAYWRLLDGCECIGEFHISAMASVVFYVAKDCAGLGTGYLALIKSDMPLGEAFLLWRQQTTIVSYWTPWIDPSRRTLVSYGCL